MLNLNVTFTILYYVYDNVSPRDKLAVPIIEVPWHAS